MTFSIALVLLLLVAAIVLFATEKITVDLITFILLVTLVTTGILTPGEAFAGFSNEIIIILGSIFVISGALRETGVLDLLGTKILQLSGSSPMQVMSMTMGCSAAVSAFMNNTTVTAMMQPPVIGIARRMQLSPSLFLMPLAFASIMGGTCSLIGTSTNVAVSGYLKKQGLQEIGMFEITPIGVIVVIIGITYMLFIGRRLLPKHDTTSVAAGYDMRQYLSEIIVMPGSPLVGQRSYDSDLNILDFRVLKIIRGNEHLQPDSRVYIEEGDTLLVEGKVDTLMKVKKIEGIEMKPEVDLGDLNLEDANFHVAEVLITSQSELAGRTLREVDFRKYYGLTVLAMYRHGQSVVEKISDTVLRVGDLLLVQGSGERIDAIRKHSGLSVLEEVKEPFFDPRKGMYTVLIFAAAVLLGTFGKISIPWTGISINCPLSICFLTAAVLTVMLRCVTVERAYEFVDWKLLVLIAGMTGFGTAMEKTGAAEWLAGLILNVTEPLGVMATLAGFFVLTVILTQPMSNAAAALVVLPIALKAAAILGANAHTFAITIMLAASVSFIAPFEPACILVYGPGKYRFFDFVKVGGGLTAILTVVVLPLVPVLWPLAR